MPSIHPTDTHLGGALKTRILPWKMLRNNKEHAMHHERGKTPRDLILETLFTKLFLEQVPGIMPLDSNFYAFLPPIFPIKMLSQRGREITVFMTVPKITAFHQTINSDAGVIFKNQEVKSVSQQTMLHVPSGQRLSRCGTPCISGPRAWSQPGLAKPGGQISMARSVTKPPYVVACGFQRSR